MRRRGKKHRVGGNRSRTRGSGRPADAGSGVRRNHQPHTVVPGGVARPGARHEKRAIRRARGEVNPSNWTTCLVQESISREGGTTMTTRRIFTPQFKAQSVLQVLTGARTAAKSCRECPMSAQRLNRWKAQFLEELSGILDNGARQSRPRNGLLTAHGPNWAGTIALVSARTK